MSCPEPEVVYRSRPIQPARPWMRLLLVAAGIGILGLFVVARLLAPDSSGTGTHEQLGLAPCGFKLMFGIPCPSCGMTTSWSWLARGDLVQACRANFGGVVLGVFSLMFAIWSVASGLAGRWFPCLPSVFWWALMLGGIGTSILGTWVLKLST